MNEIDKIENNTYYTEHGPDDGIWIHPWLKGNLDDLKHAVLHNDWDGVLFVDGMEGSGKSTLAQQIGGYLDPDLNLDNIVFTQGEFMQAMNQATKGTCVIWDESDMYATNWMDKKQQAIKKRLQIIRSKNLFLIIVAPYFFDFKQDLAVSRSRALIHVVAEGFTRGKYEFYNYNSKKMLYFKGKRHYSYHVVDHDWSNMGRFNEGYYVDRQAYLDKKERDPDTNETKACDACERAVKEEIVKELYDETDLTQKDIGDITDWSQAQISNVVRNTD